MNLPSPGIVQALQHGGDDERLFFQTTAGGKEVGVKDATAPSLVAYDPGGDVVQTAADMTQIGTTNWWYLSIDASDGDAWAKGVNYRAVVTWTDETNELERSDPFLFDVCAYPLTDPIVVSEDIDRLHPGWAAFRVGSWDDWSIPCQEAHAELLAKFRGRRDDNGDLVYPHMVMQADQLRPLALAVAEFKCVEACERLWNDHLERYAERVTNAWGAMPPIILDLDDDGQVDDDEAAGEHVGAFRLVK